jgi:hypothetical protein
MSSSTAVFEESVRAPSMPELNVTCDKLASAEVSDTNAIAALLLKMSLRYYADVLRQAQQSFFLSLGAAAVGIAFFLYAAWSSMHGGQAKIGIITGALIEAISAIGFYLYGRAASQFGSFHICLERMNRFLIANSMCESMEPQKRDEVRSALVDVIAHAPLLTFDIMSGGRSTSER